MGSQQQVCRGCGKLIQWATNPATGKKVPLDMRAPIYRVVELPNGEFEAIKEIDGDVAVSHFATCSKANDFSGGGKR